MCGTRLAPRGDAAVMETIPLVGRLILLLEDEPLIGADVAGTLEDAGARVLGPLRSAPDALAAIEAAHGGTSAGEGPIDAAVLDVNLGDHDGEPVAARLEALGVPFVLHSGEIVPRGAPITRFDAPIVLKPCHGHEIVAALLGKGSRGDLCRIVR